MARCSICGSSHAAFQLPIPGCARSAETPLECAATRWAAMNHVISSRWLRRIKATVVYEVWRPQAPRSKPSGQRKTARWRAQASSYGKRSSNCLRERGRSYFHRLGASRAQCERTAPSIPYGTQCGLASVKGIGLSLDLFRHRSSLFPTFGNGNQMHEQHVA